MPLVRRLPCPLVAAALVLGCGAVAGCSFVTEGWAPVPPNHDLRYASDFARYAPSGCLVDGTNVGAWSVQFAGDGCVRPQSQGGWAWLHLAPRGVRGAGPTRSALAVGPRHGAAFWLSLRVITDGHLRVGAPPNPWEVAWVVWDYADDARFYYAVLKPNGWEIGKRDPSYPGGQRIMMTGHTPAFPTSRWYTVVVERANERTTVSADGVVLASFVDTERPYRGGRVGLYTEDAATRFAGVVLAEAGR